MRMSRQNLEPKDCWMQMTSMIDIVFLLNIFFMLVNDMTTLQVESLTLPIAYQATEDKNPPKGRIVVNVLSDGMVRISMVPYKREALEAFLAREAVKRQDADGLSALSLKIRADADVQYKYVQEVMMACMKARIWRVSFGVSPEDAGRTVAPRKD
jgi:biopolymer transport protein ExbD